MGLVIDCHRISASDAKIKKFTCLITVFFFGWNRSQGVHCVILQSSELEGEPEIIPI